MSRNRPLLSRRSFLGLQAAALAAALPACSSGDGQGNAAPSPEQRTSPRSVAEIRESGMLRVGLYSDNKPFSFVGQNGYYVGIDGYFCIYLPYKIGMGIEYVALDAPDRYDALTSHDIDLALTVMSPADERSDEVAFTRPIYHMQLSLASPSASPITDISQLAGKELIVCEGTYAAQYARETWPDVQLRPYQTYTDSRIALEEGRGAALLDDDLGLLAWLKVKKGYTLSMRGLGSARYVAPAVVAGNDELRELIDRAASDFISSGYSKKGYEKYVKPTITENQVAFLCSNDDAEATQ